MIEVLINGQSLNGIRDIKDLQISIDLLEKKESADINVNELRCAMEAKDYLNKRIFNGLSGGQGVTEGEPVDIIVKDEKGGSFTYAAYLDFMSETTILGGEEIVCALKKRQGVDWLNETADSFSVAFLYDLGVVKKSDFIKVPYIINYVPDGMQLIVLQISVFTMAKELAENIEYVADQIAHAGTTSIPDVGVGVGVGAVTVTTWEVGDWIYFAARIAIRLAYTIAIVIAIKNLIDEIFSQLFPKKRDHLGMTFRKMFERCCEYKSLTFESSISELDWVHIPSKDRKGGSDGESGVPAVDSPIYTFGDLIRTCKLMFNADFTIENGILKLERRDKFQVGSNYQIPSYFNDQDRLLDSVSLNTDEFVSNYNIFWDYDTQDQNTLDDQTGRIFQATTTQKTSVNNDLINLKNLAQVNLPFSMAKEKTGYTGVEDLAISLGKVVDNLTGIFGGGTNYANKIKNRIGTLLLSSDYISKGKVVVMNGSKLANNQRTLLSVNNFWDKYHFINSFAEVDGVHNQYYRYEGVRVPMILSEFTTLQSNNVLTNDLGEKIEIEKISWTPEELVATIDYRVNRKYTNNLIVNYEQ